MKCAQYRSLMNSVFDGQVPVETIAMANDHIESCTDCRAQHDSIMDLHERVVDLSENIVVPDSLEARILAQLELAAKGHGEPGAIVGTMAGTTPVPEPNSTPGSPPCTTSRSKPRFLTFKWIASAAAAVGLGAAAAYFLLVPPPKNIQLAKTGSQSQRIDRNENHESPEHSGKLLAAKTEAERSEKNVLASQSKDSLTVRDFADHTRLHVVKDFHYQPAQLSALAKELGFGVKPPELKDWTLGDVCVCSMGSHNEPIVHMTYSRVVKGRRRILTCFQVLRSDLDQASNDATSTGRVHTVVDGELSVAFARSGKFDRIFVGDMPVKTMTLLAERS